MRVKGSILKWIVRALAALAALAAASALAFVGMQISGRGRLRAGKAGARPDLTAMRGSDGGGPAEAAGDEGVEGWREGDVRHKGAVYRYNEDMLTFLFLGIDRMGKVDEEAGGGQADAVFLLALDPHKKAATVIGVNRDAMTDIEVYSDGGGYLGTVKGQLCLQYAYGDGGELSRERSTAAVSRLFYGLPIHGCCAVNMGAIPLLNDAVGGVEVTALEDVAYPGGTFREGERVRLEGMGAYHYLHDRDTGSFNSAGRRLERQKQYLREYAKAARAALKEDAALPLRLYGALEGYMVTDVTADEAAYLAAQAAGLLQGGIRVRSVEGEARQGERFEEFHVDEEALYELILEVFYEEVGGEGSAG